MKIVIGPKTFSNLSLPLSFIIPALVRMIPELQFPYPIGFDTPSYLAQAEVYAKNMLLFPLLFQLLGLLYDAGVNPIVSMKVIPTLLYGSPGLSIYIFGNSYL